MRREQRFVLSHRPYAVALASYSVEAGHAGTGSGWCRINAVWFRRRDGRTLACVGELRTTMRPIPRDAQDFLVNFTDGRYGGACKGRWDGNRYWGAQEPDVIDQHLELLKPMLEGYPAAPAGWDGWWTFR